MNRTTQILTLILALFMTFGLTACEEKKPKEKPKAETPKDKPQADATSEKPEEKADATVEKPEAKADATVEKPEADAGAAPPADPPPADAGGEYLRFKVGHVGDLKNVAVGNMKFSLTKATIDFTDLTKAENMAQFEVDLTTIDTGVPDRDKHLKSPDFFDVAQFAKATITVKDVKAGEGEGAYTATATLNVHGVEKALPVTFKAIEKTDTSATIEGNTEFKRTDFKVGMPAGEKGPVDETRVEFRVKLMNK